MPPLFSDKKLAGRVATIEDTQKTLLEQNKKILALLSKQEEPEPEEVEDEEVPENEDAPEDADTVEDEDTPEDEQPEPPKEKKAVSTPWPKATAKPKAQSAAVAEISNEDLAKQIADLNKRLNEITQKGVTSEISKIGIKPIARVDKSDGEESDPRERTRKNWSRPIVRA